MPVAILKYNAGNVQSVLFAMKRLGATAMVTNNHDDLRAASHVIIPGVGEAKSAMAYFREHGLDTLIPTLKQPVLGICLGLQVMCAHSEEGNTSCLGIFPHAVRRFVGPEKIPQIGWNTVEHGGNGLFHGIPNPCFMYYVHSYFAELNPGQDPHPDRGGEPGSQPERTGTSEYMVSFSAALSRDNFHAVQFHPEKSADAGGQLLANFLRLT